MTTLCNNDEPQAVQSALAILGDKWSALILRMLHEGPKRFKDFEQNLDGMSPRTLSQRLDKLVCGGIIQKHTCPASPGYFEYSLTQKGADLDPIIHAMALWGKKHASTNTTSQTKT